MQVAKGQLAPLSTVQIIQQQQQQQQKLPSAVTMQQIQQIVRQQAQQHAAQQHQQQQQQQQHHQQQQQQTPIQQIITSVPPTQTSTVGATVLTSQIMTQPALQSRLSGQSATTTTVTRSSAPVTVTAVPVNTQLATVVSQAMNVGVHQSAPTVTLATSQPTLVKHIQEVVQVSPTKGIPIQTSVAQQLKTVQAVRQVQAVSIGQTPGLTTAIQVQGQQIKQQPSIAVQQAVQQVQAQAQQQAQQRQQALAAAVAAGTVAGNVVSAVQTPGNIQVTQQGQATMVQAATQQQLTDQQKASPYGMRLRNQPKH